MYRCCVKRLLEQRGRLRDVDLKERACRDAKRPILHALVDSIAPG